MSKEFVMYRIDKKLYKELQLLKVTEDKATINQVIEMLIKEHKESNK